MKFTIDAAVFAELVGWAARYLPARAPVPVLAGLRLAAADGQASVSAFDYETCVHAEAPADVAADGTVLVPGRLLAGITARLHGDHLQLAADDPADGTTLTLTCGRAAFTLRTLPAESYPAPPAMPTPAGQADATALAQALTQTVAAAAHDDTVPTLWTVRIDLDPAGPLTLTGTDRYRLAQRRITWQPTQPTPPPDESADDPADEAPDAAPATVFVPRPVAAELAKTLTQHAAGQPVTLGVDIDDTKAGGRGGLRRGRLLGVAMPGRHIITRLIDGENIAAGHKALLNLQPAGHARLDTARLLDAVRRVAVIADRNTPIRLTFTTATNRPTQTPDEGTPDGELQLAADDADDASGHDALPAHYHSDDGQPYTIAFNPHFLTAALTVLGADTTHLAFTGPNKPCLITPAPLDDPALDHRHLLMPLRLSV